MDKEKFRISIIDFLPQHGKFEVGKDKNGTPELNFCIAEGREFLNTIFLGDCKNLPITVSGLAKVGL